MHPTIRKDGLVYYITDTANMDLYNYKGTTFLLNMKRQYGNRSYYEIAGMIDYGDIVEIPSMASGTNISGLSIEPTIKFKGQSDVKADYSGIKELRIPGNISIDSLENHTFPGLEKMDFSSPSMKYELIDGMLYEQGGRKLVLSLGRGMRDDTVIVPPVVEEISGKAFKFTLCNEIIFQNKHIKADPHAFDSSVWLDTHKKNRTAVYVGSTLYRLFSSEEFELPEWVESIDTQAFNECIPERFVTHIVPPAVTITGNGRGACRELTIKGNYHVDRPTLAKWNTLSHIYLQGNDNFKDINGVVFSKDGRRLIFYPPQRKDDSYCIPDGVKIVAEQAFAGQQYLKKVMMPDSVRMLCPGAFYGCSNLEMVKMSDQLQEINSATVFEPKGVFQDCTSLRDVVFPPELRYIGDRAFSGASAIEKLELPDNLEEIGRYSFEGTQVRKIYLPKSLRCVGNGAFAANNDKDTVCIYAYEGSAKGLIEAVEAVQPGAGYDVRNVEWRRARIAILDNTGKEKAVIFIPEKMKRQSGGLLDDAWNQESFDFGLYCECFGDMENTDEKIDIAMKMLSCPGEKERSVYEAYLRQEAPNVARKKAASGEEKELTDFIGMGFMSRAALMDILKICNEKDMQTASAYILNELGKMSHMASESDSLRI